jgi:1,4-dihydroxy-2-naphthoate octaprenyltransferase
MQKTTTSFKSWMQAIRLRTLFLSFACVFAGTWMSVKENQFDASIFVFTLLTALFLQILSNLANDYGDSIHGADNAQRKGPLRTVQTGQISATQMKKALFFVAVFSFFSGITLLFSCYPIIGLTASLVMLGMGLTAIAAAIFYTNGKRPYGYRGLGDISVFLFFGILGLLGTSFLQSGTVTIDAVYLAISFGFLSVGVLNINNMRDIEADKIAGKFSIPVRIGLAQAKRYHFVLIFMAMLSCMACIDHAELNFMFLILPFAALIFHIWKISRCTLPEHFDPLLKQLSLTTFLLAICLFASIWF